MTCSQIVFTICLLIFYVNSQRSEQGETCILERTGEAGQCRSIFYCPGTIEGVQRRTIYPQPCGSGYLRNHTPVVCCALRSINSPPLPVGPVRPARPARPVIPVLPQPKVTQTSLVTGRTTKKVGDKSKAKCQEYQKYSKRPSTAITGLFIDTVPQDECVLGEVENVINGKLAKPKEFPHMALLGYEGTGNKKIKWSCGGSLISNKFVLTAAHCLSSINYGDVKYVRLGDLDIDSTRDDAEPQEFTVKNIFLPPNYTRTTKHRDIALIELNDTAELNPYVRPACLNLKETLTNGLAIASGWGHTTAGVEELSKDLLKVTLEIFSHSECSNVHRSSKGGILEETQICAGSHNDSSDTCQGDSGGPLQILSSTVDCSYEIIGVTSYGIGCGTAKSPGVYVRVSTFIKWIEDTVWPDL